MITFINKSERKLSKALSGEGYNIPYSVLSALLKKKDVKIDGSRISKDKIISAGQRVEIYYTPVDIDLDVVYMDENVAVINKRSGFYSQEIFRAVEKKFGEAYFIHRLDRNTEGLIIFALNKASEKELIEGFKKRNFQKKYLATVYGTLKEKSAEMTAYLLKDEKNSKVDIYDKKVKNSVEIKTGYRVIEEKPEVSLLEVELFTGKTHQIRAHLAHIGHFVIGDGKYGNDEINKRLGANKLMLKSYKLTLNFRKEDLLFYLNGKTFELK